MDNKHWLLLTACIALAAGELLEGCSPHPSPKLATSTEQASEPPPAAPPPVRASEAGDEASGAAAAAVWPKSGESRPGKQAHPGHFPSARPPTEGPVAAAPAPAPHPPTIAAAPEPAPVPAPSSSTGPSAAPYPHVDAIFYAETPERVGEEAKACLEILAPGVSASSLTRAAYQCKPASTATRMTAGTPVAKEDGSPGVDTSEYMKATLDYDSEDFEVPTRELLMRFASPGEHKSFEFTVIPKRIGERQLTVRLFTTDKDGNVVDDIFDGSSTVHVDVGHDPAAIFGWLLDHWEGLAGIGGVLVALWMGVTRKPLEWLRRSKAGGVSPAAPESTGRADARPRAPKRRS